jgi:anti-anti-sigma regulatory factor
MAEQADGTLKLVSPQPVVARMMALWGADQLIAVHDSVAGAAG